MTNEVNLSVARKLAETDEINQALEILDQILVAEPEMCDALLLRGHIYYRMQQWGNAMNDYTAVLELDPDNDEARLGLEMANNILGYFTPDMFNP